MKPHLKAAVICSQGIGDGLMMMVASHRLKLEGYEVTTFQDALHQLAPLFPGHTFSTRRIPCELQEFDLIILQNDNTSFSRDIIQRYRSKLSIFYSSYDPHKHPPLIAIDRIFNRSRTMVDNIATSIASILGQVEPIPSNGITMPGGLTHRKYPKRALIHPTSTSMKRTYSPSKFLTLATILAARGVEVVFCVSPQERPQWEHRLNDQFQLPNFPSLTELASYTYESALLIGNESGTGHLASNLGIPTIIIASCPKQMELWRPGFLQGEVITPSKYIPNIKGLRIRSTYWQQWITPQQIARRVCL